jgi:hypothetical protein
MPFFLFLTVPRTIYRIDKNVVTSILLHRLHFLAVFFISPYSPGTLEVKKDVIQPYQDYHNLQEAIRS